MVAEQPRLVAALTLQRVLARVLEVVEDGPDVLAGVVSALPANRDRRVDQVGRRRRERVDHDL